MLEQHKTCPLCRSKLSDNKLSKIKKQLGIEEDQNEMNEVLLNGH